MEQPFDKTDLWVEANRFPTEETTLLNDPLPTEPETTDMTAQESPPTPEEPGIVVACRPLTPEQYLAVNRLERQIPKFLWVTVLFLVWAMATNSIGYAALIGGENASAVATATLWLLALVAGGFFWFAQYRERKMLLQMFAQGLLGENSDEQVVELYEEYLVALTPHSRMVLRYEDVTAFWETSSLLVLFSETAAVVWRSEDCTPYDAALLKAHLLARIPASARHQKGVFLPRLPYPLPLPVFRSMDEPVMVCTHVPRFVTKLWNEGWFSVCNKSLPVWFAVSAVLGVFMINAYWWDTPLLRSFAPWFLVCFFLVCPLVSLLCVFLQQWGAYRRLRNGPNGGRATVCFTRDGLCIEKGDSLVFVPRYALHPRYKKWGVLFLLPSGAVTIPWKQIPDTTQFRAHFSER